VPRTVRVAILILFVASTIIAGAPRLIAMLRTAKDLVPLHSLDERRATLFGAWYPAIEQLKRDTPPASTIDFVMLRPEARDIVVLGAAELQPRDVRLFDGWAAWKRRERAILLHDDRAANAVPGAAPRVADVIVIVDPASDPPLRRSEPPH
jgi:hypothetical protein